MNPRNIRDKFWLSKMPFDRYLCLEAFPITVFFACLMFFSTYVV